MRAALLQEHLSGRGSYHYRGDPESQLLQVVFTPRHHGKGAYLVVIDATWQPKEVERFGVAEPDLEHHVQSALEAGIEGFICDEETASHPAFADANVFYGRSSQDLAFRIAEVTSGTRNRRRITAITGSAGKSTTKAMLTHALEATGDAQRVYSPPSSQNIARSVIHHLTRVNRRGHSVIEVAGSCFPIFTKHDFTVSPDISIVTAISEAHLDYLGDLEGVARHKSQLFNRPASGGTAIINADAPHSGFLMQRAVEEGCQLVTYGEAKGVTVQLHSYDSRTGDVVARIGRELIEYRIAAPGHHMAVNSLAVLAALRSYRIPTWRTGIQSLSTFQPLHGRGQVSTVELSSEVKVTVVDESYNANPASMRAALQLLAGRGEEHGAWRRIAVLGDMLELGAEPASLHMRLAEAVLDSPPDILHLFGDHMLSLYHAVRDELPEVNHWTNVENLSQQLRDDAKDGDMMLVKSSNGTGLHAIVSDLLSSGGA